MTENQKHLPVTFRSEMNEIIGFRIKIPDRHQDTLYFGHTWIPQLKEALQDPHCKIQLISRAMIRLMSRLDLGTKWDNLVNNPTLFLQNDDKSFTVPEITCEIVEE